MTEHRWTTDELDRIGDADELHIAPRRKDGTLRRAAPIWVARVGDELYVRSWRGDDGHDPSRRDRALPLTDDVPRAPTPATGSLFLATQRAVAVLGAER